MGALKTVGVIGAVSGIGLIGYYLLNKYKPTIAEQQIDEIKGQGYVLRLDTPQHRKLWSIVAQYGYDNLEKNKSLLDLKNQLLTQNPLIIDGYNYTRLTDFLADMNSKGVSERILGKELYNLNVLKKGWEKRTQNLAEQSFKFDKFGNSFGYQTNCEYNPSKGEKNPCAYNYKPFPYSKSDYYKYALNENSYFWKIPNPSGEDISIVASNCVELDKHIKTIQDRIVEQTKKEPNEDRRRVLVWFKEILEDKFQLHGCRDKIEKQRLLDSAKTQTIFSIKAEDSVLGASQKNQNIYLGAGALVLVLSTGLLLSAGKSSTPTSGSFKSSGLLGNLVIVGGLTGMGYLIFKKPKVVLPNENK
jgi:hypothetical protein